jgi:PAS domain S-box-containing protein
MPTEEQAWLANQIVQESQDAIIMADREGVIRLWNKGAQKIFGFTPAEALGQSLHINIPEISGSPTIRAIARLWKAGPADIPRNFWQYRPSRKMAAGYQWNLP